MIPACFSTIIIITCVFKIVTGENETPEIRTVWWTTLTSTGAAWLPSFAGSKRDDHGEDKL